MANTPTMLAMSDAELEKAQHIGAAAYLRAYIIRMSRSLEVPMEEFNMDAVNAMTLMMLNVMNESTEAAWRMLMNEDLDEVTAKLMLALRDLRDGR